MSISIRAGLISLVVATVLVGCGYGRIALRVAEMAHRVAGIDTAPASLELARQMAGTAQNCEFLQMDALDLRFPDGSFDVVLCLQNKICAFGVDVCAGGCRGGGRRGGRFECGVRGEETRQHGLLEVS